MIQRRLFEKKKKVICSHLYSSSKYRIHLILVRYSHIEQRFNDFVGRYEHLHQKLSFRLMNNKQ